MSKFRKVRGARNQFVPDKQFAPRPHVVEVRTTRELVGQRIGFLTKDTYETLDSLLREHGEILRFRRAPTPEEKAIMEDAEKNFFYKHNYYRWMLKQPFRVLSGPWPFFDDLFLEEEKKSDWFNSAWFDDIRFQGQEFANIGKYKKDDLLVLHQQSAPKFRRDINRIVQLWRVNPEFGARMESIAKGEIVESDEYWWFPEWIKYRTKRLNEKLIDMDEGLHRGEQTIFMFEELEEDDYVRLQLCVDLGKLENNPDYFQQCERTHLRYYITPTSLATRHMWVIRPGDDGTQERFLPRSEAMKHNSYVHHMNDEKWKAKHGYLSEEEAQKILNPKKDEKEEPEYEELSEEEKLEEAKKIGQERDATRERLLKIMRGEITFDVKTNKKGKKYYIERVNGENFHEAREKAESIVGGEEKKNKLPAWWFLPRKEKILLLAKQGKEEVENWEKNKNDYQIIAPDKRGNWKVVVDSTRDFSPALWELLWYLMEDWGDWRYRESMTMEQFKSRTNWYDWDEGNDRGIVEEDLEPDSWKLLEGKAKEARWYRFNQIQLRMGEAKNSVILNEFQKERLQKHPEFLERVANNKIFEEKKKECTWLARYDEQGFILQGNSLKPCVGNKFFSYSKSPDIVKDKMKEKYGVCGITNIPPYPYQIGIKFMEPLLKDYQSAFFRNTSLKPLSYCEFSRNGRGRDNMTRAQIAVEHLYNGMWRQLGQKYGIRYLEIVPTYRNIEKIARQEKEKLEDRIVFIQETREWLKKNDPVLYKKIEKRNKKKWELPKVLDENQKDKLKKADDWVMREHDKIKLLSNNPKYSCLGEEIRHYHNIYTLEVSARRKKLRDIYDKAVQQGVIEPIPEEEIENEKEEQNKTSKRIRKNGKENKSKKGKGSIG